MFFSYIFLWKCKKKFVYSFSARFTFTFFQAYSLKRMHYHFIQLRIIENYGSSSSKVHWIYTNIFHNPLKGMNRYEKYRYLFSIHLQMQKKLIIKVIELLYQVFIEKICFSVQLLFHWINCISLLHNLTWSCCVLGNKQGFVQRAYVSY